VKSKAPGNIEKILHPK